MDELVLLGSILGAVLGLAHGAYVFSERISRRGSGFSTALYYAVWTLALWTAFGTYVLVLSLIAIPPFAIRGVRRKLRGSRSLRESWT